MLLNDHTRIIMANGCPQCGCFIGMKEKGDMTNYNIVKGAVGEALLGSAGALAGFENKTLYECSACGCIFYWNTLTTTKMLKRGYKTSEYQAPVGKGDMSEGVECSNGYSYQIRKSDVGSAFETAYFEIKKPGDKGFFEKHVIYSDTKKFEYDYNGPYLIAYYPCKDGRERPTRYNFDTEENLKKFISIIKSVIDDQKSRITLGGVGGPAELIDITKRAGQKNNMRTSEKKQLKIALISVVLCLIVFLVVVFSAGFGPALISGSIAFLISEVYCQFKID